MRTSMAGESNNTLACKTITRHVCLQQSTTTQDRSQNTADGGTVNLLSHGGLLTQVIRTHWQTVRPAVIKLN